MEQIYYTQCPIGYGLGASNGFQIKRMTGGYPTSGDFRHLGVRAFPGGGRTLAPVVLRYRRDGDVAEVARLTPRAHEYQTERGLWGRPGGVFTHGVRLDAGELGSVGNWPAGLFDNPLWRTADPEPTRGRPPDDLDLAALTSFRPAGFDAVGSLFEGADAGWLARVWTALAQVTREGRTLFLIDEPDRLARSIAALTVAFPASLRADLTFSTFHDRPEELPGYRIQGTSPGVRPNRLALLAQGIIADRGANMIEPALAPAPWAVTLAGWLTRREPVDEADWSATEARARGARHETDPVERIWADDWLDPLVGFPGAERSRDRPDSAAAWVRLGAMARWSDRAGIGDDWLRRRGPDWWSEALEPTDSPDLDRAARAALVAHATLRDAWRGAGDPATGWGDALAAWFGDADPVERDEAGAAVFQAAPRSARPSFAQALLRGLSPEAGAATLAQLRANPAADRAMLLPLEAGLAAATLIAASTSSEAGEDALRTEVAAASASLGRLIQDAASLAGATAAALSAVHAVARDHPRFTDLVARAVAGAFDPDAASGGREGLAWVLRRDDASTWLAPALRSRLADPARGAVFGLLRDRVDPDQWTRLARAVLAVADDPGLPDDAFRLAVERLLLPLAPRPNQPTWAETYLRRTPSTWDLFRRLYAKEAASVGIPAWIDSARGRGEISPEQAARVDSIRQFARCLSTGDAQKLADSSIPNGSSVDRTRFFSLILDKLGGDRLEGLPLVLDACRAAWPGAFDPGTTGLQGLAKPLAERVAPGTQSPRVWLNQVVAILDRLGLIHEEAGFEPDGLLAEIVAALPGGTGWNPWPLRQFLFEDDRAWPTLTLLIRSDLGQVAPTLAAELVDRWDNKLGKSSKPGLVGRFWELILNAADPPRLGAIVVARAKDLQSLGTLRWWSTVAHPDATSDLRDAYVRTTPLEPTPTGKLAEIERWLEGSTKKPVNLDEPIPLDEPATEPSRVSPLGRDRWRCLRALTEYRPTSPAPSADREARFLNWEADLPLAGLTPEDRYRFLGWIILGIDPTDPPRTTERLAAWLVRSGVVDPRRVSRWVDELPLDVSAQEQMDRAAFVGTLGKEIRTLAEEAKGRKGPVA